MQQWKMGIPIILADCSITHLNEVKQALEMTFTELKHSECRKVFITLRKHVAVIGQSTTWEDVPVLAAQHSICSREHGHVDGYFSV